MPRTAASIVADWYDPGVGGHGMGDTTRGRIYRLAPKGNKPSVPKVDLERRKALPTALASPNLAVRDMAMAKIAEHGSDAARGPCWKPAADTEGRPRLASAGAVAARHVAAGSGSNQSPPSRTRTRVSASSAMRILKDIPGPVAGRLHRLMAGRPCVKDAVGAGAARGATACCAMRTRRRRKPLIFELWRRSTTARIASTSPPSASPSATRQDRREIILADFDKQFPEWNDKVADLVWELRPPSMMPLLGKRLADKSLTPANGPHRGHPGRVRRQGGRRCVLEGAANGRAAGGPPEGHRQFQAVPAEQVARSARQQGFVRIDPSRLMDKPETRITGLNLIAAAEKTEARSAQVAKSGC